jgi:hypothetical protein
MTQEALNSDLYTQVSGKQNTINVLNKLPVAHVDLTGSVLENMDYHRHYFAEWGYSQFSSDCR